MSDAPASTPAATPPGAFRRLLRNRAAVAAIVVLGLIVLVAVLWPVLASYAPGAFPYAPETTTAAKNAAPSAQHWFGTDLNGRDVFSRVIQGARISLLVGFLGAMVSFFIGTTYGLISGYAGGRVDNVMMRFVEILHSVPRLIIVIVAIFAFETKLADWLNTGTLFSIFGDNPRIMFLLLVIFFTVWWAAARNASAGWKAALLGVCALLVAWPIAEYHAGPVALTWQTWPAELRSAADWHGWNYVPAATLLALVCLFIFGLMHVQRAEGRSGFSAGWIVAVIIALSWSPHIERQLANVPLRPFVGYSKVVILIICLGLIEWLSMARIVRGQVLALKEQQFVLAARALGQSHTRILVRHLLPNLVGVVVIYLTLTIPAVILDESFLSFLGLGVNDPQASWGSLLSDGKNVINPVKSYWWLLVFPAAAMSITLLALNFLGDALRDALDPRAQR